MIDQLSMSPWLEKLSWVGNSGRGRYRSLRDWAVLSAWALRPARGGAATGEGGAAWEEIPADPVWEGIRQAVRAFAAACVLNCGFVAMAEAQALPYLIDLRRHGSLFEGLAEPPPDNVNGMVVGKALSGEPEAPFVFSGVMHIADAQFESHADYSIGGSAAVVNTHEEAKAYFGGVISNMPGSTQGLMKLGAGTLALSGANTYSGATFLLQGTLQARSDSAWGWASLQAATGSKLEYAPGVVMASPLHIAALRVEDWASPGSYGPVAAPEHADKLRWSVADGQAVHAGLLQGDAPFVKQGAGRLNITGDALGYTGGALVEQGTLAVNDMFGGAVSVGAGARLEGGGMVSGAEIMAGGTLAPGNSIGTLRVGGDLRFEPGSRFEVEVAPDGAGDAVWASGKAMLAGDVMALAQAGLWRASTSYTLLKAEGGLDGTRFDAVLAPVDFAFLTPQLSYAEDAVTLTLLRNETPLDDVAETPDETEVAEVIEGEEPGSEGGPEPVLYDELLVLDRPAARDALRQLSGSWSASVLSGLMDDSRFVREAALGNAYETGLWSRGFYSSATRDGVEGVPGDSRSLHGVVLGGNRDMGSGWRLGGYLGVQHARLDRAGSGGVERGAAFFGDMPLDGGRASATVQSTHLGFAASGGWKPLRLAVGVAHTWHAVKSRRQVAFGNFSDSLSSRYRAGSVQVFAEAGWPMWLSKVQHPPSAREENMAILDRGDLGGRPDSLVPEPRVSAAASGPRDHPDPLILEPFVRLAYLRTRAQGFDESGGAAALSVSPARHSVLFSTLGLRLEQSVNTGKGQWRLQAQLAWHYASGAGRVAADQRFSHGAGREFTSHGLPIARKAWSLDLAVTGRISRRASLSLGYAGQFAVGSRDHGVRVNAQWVF